jgi:hypothetical protein|tara:strand:- start:108 stop:680 length:573 start_codon:yes stop_codon:yes gene_type:complete
MAVYLQNSAFVHIPKTGGIWVKDALKSCASVERDHIPTTAHFTPNIYYGVFLFVRKPCSWLGSLFSQRKYKKWNWDSNELESTCKSEDFDEFIDNVCNNEGVVERYFNQYTQKYEINNDLQVGRQENLCNDLIRILKHFNEPFNEEGLLKWNNTKRNNSGKKFGFRFELTEKQKNKVYFSQKGFYNKYYE